ncbi:MAG: DUF502 domain-containing protein [Candidatus Methylomirabilia bacterium]
MKRLAGYFFQGFLYIAPLGVTGYVIFRVFAFINTPVRQLEELFLDRHIPGLGLLTVVALLTLLGWLGSTIIARPVKAFARKLLDRAPLIGMIEGAVRDLLSALFAKERRFSHPVIVQMSGISDLEKLGFITQEDLADLGLREKVAVYFPHSYNFSGELYIVPRERVRIVDISAQAAMKFIVSGGMIHLKEHRDGT